MYMVTDSKVSQLYMNHGFIKSLKSFRFGAYLIVKYRDEVYYDNLWILVYQFNQGWELTTW